MADVIGITALNRYVKTLLESDAVLTDIALRGEISNFKNHFRTGHLYFSLKDSQSSVKAVMFRGNALRLRFEPQDGMLVIVRGRISLYERDGAFQVYVEDMFPDGVGALQMAFEQLKAKLAAEGLFAPEHKRPLPQVPRCVGLVTSKTGAAIQDIFNVTKRRYPAAHFLLAPVNVQGQEAAWEIARAIRRLGNSGKTDVIIVARGGGSREDLWVFNDEEIARAAYDSPVPVVSAIGHEIDFCILDFVSDVRAPTPSAAAELVMPDLPAAVGQAEATFGAIARTMQKKLDLCKNQIDSACRSPQMESVRRRPLKARTELGARAALSAREMRRRLNGLGDHMAAQAALSESLSPLKVLARGYAVAEKENRILKCASDAVPGDRIRVTLHRGALLCEVNSVEKGETADEKESDV